MADGNQTFFDRSVRYAIFLERYKAGVVNRLQELILELNEVQFGRLERALGRLSGLELERFVSGADAQSEAGKRFRELVAEMRAQADEALGIFTITELTDITRLKPARLARLARDIKIDVGDVPEIDADKLLAKTPFQGRILSEWTEEWSDRRMRRAMSAFKDSLIKGEGIDGAAAALREASSATVRGAQVMARTAFNHVNAQSEVAFVEDNLELIRAVEWTAVLDTRTSEVCRSNDGKQYKPSNPRWKNLLPAHPACLPGDCYVSTRDAVSAVSERRFEGDFIVIEVASGLKLTCTPNHPILTNFGWVPAQEIVNRVHKVVCDLGSKRTASVNYQGDNIAPTIHDVAKAFRCSPGVVTREVPTAAPDFHGDGVEGEVAEVNANWDLSRHYDASGCERIIDVSFKGAAMIKAPSFGSCSAGQFRITGLPACRGQISRASDCLSLALGGAVHARLLLLTSVSWLSSGSQENLSDMGDHKTQIARHAHDSDSFIKKLDDFPRLGLGDAEWSPWSAFPAVYLNTVSRQEILNRLEADRIVISNGLNLFARHVCLDDVVSVRRVPGFSGQVFNLQTSSEAFVANGFLTHNCRSFWTILFTGEGQVERTDYYDWLRGQDEEIQKEALGATRAKLFREGGLSKEQLVKDATSGQPYTLDELREREEAAFDRAGIE